MMKKQIITLLILLPLKGLMAQIISGVAPTIPPGAVQFSSGMTILAGGSLDNQGMLVIDGDLEIHGTLVNMHGLELQGTVPQQYLGLPMTVDSLIVNTVGATIAAPVTVRQGAMFTAGLLASSAANPLIFSSGAGTGMPTDGSHVNGPARYDGTSAFIFPVGNEKYYRPVGVNLSSNGSGMTAVYFPGAAPSNSSLLAPLLRVSSYEYWTLTPVSTAIGTVTLNWDGSKVGSGILTPQGVAALQVAQLDGSSWASSGGMGSGTPAQGSITSSGAISTWSTFALGSINPIDAPLPLKFLGISAVLLSDGSRKVDWQVAEESQLKDYTVERSIDGLQFSDVGTVRAMSAMDYGYIDALSVSSGKLFYRVRGNDLDGKATYSTVTSVESGSGASAFAIGLMPNPVKDQLTVSFGPGMQGRYELDLLTIDGRSIYHAEFQTAGNQRFVISRPGGLSAGTYVGRFSDDNGYVHTYKLIFE